MTLSIIVSILNSQEIVRRQLLHFEKMGLPDDVELLFMDDGSNPPLSTLHNGLKNLRIIRTINPPSQGNIFNDGRVSVARNQGAREAKGEFLLMTDIDYIIFKDSIETGRNMKYDKRCFRRQLGVILEDGSTTQDFNVLRQYGLTEKRIKERGVLLPPHSNNFIMRKSVFFDLGGYEETPELIYPSKGDGHFKRAWLKYFDAGKATASPAEDRTTLWMFPNGQFCGDVDYNPFGLFHDKTRKTDKNHAYRRQLSESMSN